MLDLMRKNAGTWMVKFILGAIIIVFSFLGGGQLSGSARQSGWRWSTANPSPWKNTGQPTTSSWSGSVSASVTASTVIWSKPFNWKSRPWIRSLNKKLIMEEAERLDLRVTDAELARSVREMPFFQTAGSFDKDRYRRVLVANHMSPEEI